MNTGFKKKENQITTTKFSASSFHWVFSFLLMILDAKVETTKYYSEIEKVNTPNNNEDLIYTEI